MALDEIKITRAIIERFTEKFLDSLDLDVAIVGGGVSGLVAAGGWPKKAGRWQFLSANYPLAAACGAEG